MRAKTWLLGLVPLVAVVAASFAASAAGTPTQSPPNKPPYVLKTSWGTFKLAPRIAAKLQSHSPLNIGLSIEGRTLPIYGPQFSFGFGVGIKKVSAQYHAKLNGVLLGPVTADPTTQINQVRSALTTNSVDCLTVEGGGNPAFAPVINKALNSGVPVFTTGTDIAGSNRLATFHTNWTTEGSLDAQAVAAFFKARGTPLKEAFMTSGDITALFAQQRMTGFMTTLQKLVPGVKFDDTPKNALNTEFDPIKAYNGVKAFMRGHPTVQIVYQTDTAAEYIDKAIVDLGAKGKIFTAGHNVSLGNLNYIQTGVQIATIDQDYPAQSAYPAIACAAFLFNGKLLPNTNKDNVITAANVKQARATFIATGGTLPVKKK